jgi:broad specificity phosphatase PhoE
MLTVRFIRHGESASNAGAATRDTASTPLTALGREQAVAVRDSFIAAPELIVTSPFLRARQTAEATQWRFPEVPVEVWPVEEFTFLAPERYASTTVGQREPWALAYWQAANPFSVDGPGAESFAGLVERVHTALDRLTALPAGEVALFSHSQFMRTAHWHIECAPAVIDSPAMRAYSAFATAHPIENGGGFSVVWDGRAWAIV